MNRRAALRAVLGSPALAGLGPTAAAAGLPEEFAAIPGQPVVALAAHPAVGPRLRVMAAGRQRMVSDAVRGAGPPVVWEDGWLSGQGTAGQLRCLLAYEPRAEQVALMLWDGNDPSLFVPPRFAPWPPGLRGAVRRFNPQIEAQLRWG